MHNHNTVTLDMLDCDTITTVILNLSEYPVLGQSHDLVVSMKSLSLAQRKLVYALLRSQVLSGDEIARGMAIDLMRMLRLKSIENYRTICIGMRDESWFVRDAAVEAYYVCFARFGEAKLIPFLKDRNSIVRRKASLGLYEILGNKAEGIVRDALKGERNLNARAGMLGVLVRCGDRSALEELKLIEKNGSVRLQELISKILDDALPLFGAQSKLLAP